MKKPRQLRIGNFRKAVQILLTAAAGAAVRSVFVKLSLKKEKI